MELRLEDVLPIAIGAVFVGVAARAAWLGWRIRRWPRVPGRILESRTFGRVAGPANARTFVVEPRVLYEYEVDGRMHRGRRIALLEVFTPSRRGAERRLARYSPGRNIEVSVDPKNPRSAYLENGFAHVPIVLVFALVGGALIAFGVSKIA